MVRGPAYANRVIAMRRVFRATSGTTGASGRFRTRVARPTRQKPSGGASRCHMTLKSIRLKKERASSILSARAAKCLR